MKFYQLINEITKAEAAAYEKLLRSVYGDDYNVENTKATNLLRVPEKQKNEPPILYGDYPESGFFSVGNAKLPKDTMVIDFTSAHHCPSISFCPVSSLVCYAGRGEDRFKDKMRKNLEIEDLTRKLRAQWKAEGEQRDEQGNPIGGVSRYLELAKALIAKKNANYNAFKQKSLANSGQLSLPLDTPNQSINNEDPPGSPTPIRYVRFNECGDFPDEHTLECAIKFSEDIKNTAEYGYYDVDENGSVVVKPVRCMAYTAKASIKNPELWKRAARSFAVNASVDSIRDQLATEDENEEKIARREYNATHGSIFDMRDAMIWMDKNMKAYKDAERVLATNPNETPISEKTLEELEGIPTEGNGETNALLYKIKAAKTLDGDNSVPLLRKGHWPGSNGEQWYYICPCSFWALLKDALRRQWLEERGYEIPMTKPKYKGEDPKPNYRKIEWRGKDKEELEKYLNVFQGASPCGKQCHVCNNMNGGRNIDDLNEVIYDYHVLSAIHGGGTPFWNQSYYNKRRAAEVFDKSERFTKYNPWGKSLYGQTPTEAYFYGPLFQDEDGTLYYKDPSGKRWEKEEWEEHIKDEVKQMKKKYREDMAKERKKEAEKNRLRREMEARLAAQRGGQTTTEARNVLSGFRKVMEAINRYERQKQRDIFDW